MKLFKDVIKNNSKMIVFYVFIGIIINFLDLRNYWYVCLWFSLCVAARAMLMGIHLLLQKAFLQAPVRLNPIIRSQKKQNQKAILQMQPRRLSWIALQS